ncbi:MAG: Ni/Fe hydrogenase [Caloramator sp.]|jgi:hydrogenase large subunit|uniref:nickel-dependent hydrogenase large subunit n=1 Tax=Caloramator sp. TaxID=1871330 RepID=UPI001D48A99F|nr:nickel-dependent hydrogenase large subunit [Caloramator sp.]MBZ4664491.1 Ni/Fe hydrogenase [Caloramator sp.]
MEIVLSPITRISGFLTIIAQVDDNIVVDAKCKGTMFRGFEKLLIDKHPLDAVYLTQRICGICSSAHSIASSRALEDCSSLIVDYNSKIIRNIIHGFDILQNHIRQFYLFSIPDFVNIETENFKSKVPRDLEIKISDNYIKSLYYSTLAHQGLSILGGKAPHNHAIVFGGVTTKLNQYEYSKAVEIADELLSFCQYMLEDYYIIEKYYNEYFDIGDSGSNYLSFGLFDDTPEFSICSSGVLINKKYNELNLNDIEEYEVIDDISFIKAPRYLNQSIEVGPLSRNCIKNGWVKSSTLSRIKSRVYEAKSIAENVKNMLKEVSINKNTISKDVLDGTGIGTTDTIRGALYHSVEIQNKKINQYNIITPSAFNLSPTYNGIKGPLERALIGTYIEDTSNPIEIIRTVHSFDPCVSCATHLVSKDGVLLNENHFVHR